MSQGPWGQGPSGPPGRGGRGSQPPDLEEVIRKTQERLEKIFKGGVVAAAAVSVGTFGW